jgi:hypothetical protein
LIKIEIEWKCCHGHSNHELEINAFILIQIIKHVDALFLRDIHDIDVFRPQADQLIEPFLSKPSEEQNAVERTRFKTNILTETDEKLIIIKSGGEIT